MGQALLLTVYVYYEQVQKTWQHWILLLDTKKEKGGQHTIKSELKLGCSSSHPHVASHAWPCLACSYLFDWCFLQGVSELLNILHVLVGLHNLLLLILYQSLSEGEESTSLMWELYYTVVKSSCLNSTIQSFLYLISNGTIQIVSLAQGYTMRVIKHLYIALNLCHKELQKRHPNATLEVRWQFISTV